LRGIVLIPFFLAREQEKVVQNRLGERRIANQLPVDVRHDERLRSFLPWLQLLSIEFGGVADGKGLPLVVFDNRNDLELDLFSIVGLDNDDVL